MSHLHGGVVGVNQNDPGCPLHAVHASAPSPHDGLTQPAMADHPHPCQYQDKITTASPTTARVLLMFLRDFVELRTTYSSWTQSCPCPMEKCPQTFSEPLQLIEHLLLCPELPRGDFKCWKCSNAHGVPTNCEKDWTGPPGVQRKRSVSQKVKEAFARRGSVGKLGPNMGQKPSGTLPQDWPQMSDAQFRQLDPNGQLDVRLNQGLCQPTNTCGLNCVFTGLQTAVEGDMDITDYPECPTPTTDCSQHDQTPWAEVDSIMCGISSHTPSTIFDSGQASDSSNTSPQDSLLFLNQFSPQLVQPDGSILGSPPYLNGAAPFHTQSSLPGSAVDDIYLSSPVDPQTECEQQQWWGMAHVPPGVNPGFAPPIVCQPPADMGSPAVHMPLAGPPSVTAPEMSISRSHASSYDVDHSHSHSHNSPYGQHRGIPYATRPSPEQGMYQAEMQKFSPRPDHSMDQQPEEEVDDGSEELVCEFCNWKPRGVRDNLKGYLRKHKNTHKNLRFPCTVEGCNKDFGRLDNLKAHMRDKHPADAIPVKTEPVDEVAAVSEEALGPGEAGQKRRRDSSEQFRGIRGPLPQHSVLWSFNMG